MVMTPKQRRKIVLDSVVEQEGWMANVLRTRRGMVLKSKIRFGRREQFVSLPRERIESTLLRFLASFRL